MRAVLVEAPEHLLEERRRLGLDGRDEMWEGELHMVPPASDGHQRLGTAILLALAPVAQAAGLVLTYETGLFDPDVPEMTSYRVPDLVVSAEGQRTDRGVEGKAALVVELRSPGDETWDKVPFYARMGVAELLVVDRDDRSLTLLRLADGEELAPVPADDDGWVRLASLPVALRRLAEGTLELDTPEGTTSIPPPT